jgi:hypothetical protein
MEKPNHIVTLIAGIVITIAAIVLLYHGFITKKWKVSKGKILSSQIVHSSDDYNIEVKYSYAVDSISYFGKVLSSADSVSMNYHEAKRLADYYYEGKDVEVYYNTLHPDRAVLERGNAGKAYVPLLLGLVTLLFGMFNLLNRKVGD